MENEERIIGEVTNEQYKYGFVTNVQTDSVGKGISEEIIRKISAIKQEPSWLLDYRLKAFACWQKMTMPSWAHLNIPPIDFQDIIYYAAPVQKKNKSLEDVDPEILDTFNKLGIPLNEQKVLAGVAVDAVMDSVSVKTTFRDTLNKYGIIFCSMSEAIKNHPDLVKKYLGSVVPYTITSLLL